MTKGSSLANKLIPDGKKLIPDGKTQSPAHRCLGGGGCLERLEFDNILITGLPPQCPPWVHTVGRGFLAALLPACCSPPVTAKAPRDGKKPIPGGKKLIPDCRKLIPGGKKFIPDGKKLAPDGKKLIPDGKKLIPGGTKLIPGGKKS